MNKPLRNSPRANRIHWLTGLLLLPALLLSPASAQASEDVVMRHPPSSVRPGIIAGGLSLTAVAYGVGALSAAAWPEVPGSEHLYIPVAGPWLTLAKTGCSPDTPDCDAILYVRGILLVLGGLTQAGGLAISGEGLFMTTEADAASPPTTSWTVAPLYGRHHAGVSALGTF